MTPIGKNQILKVGDIVKNSLNRILIVTDVLGNDNYNTVPLREREKFNRDELIRLAEVEPEYIQFNVGDQVRGVRFLNEVTAGIELATITAIIGREETDNEEYRYCQPRILLEVENASGIKKNEYSYSVEPFEFVKHIPSGRI